MRVSWWVDERRDPEKATLRRGRYLKNLYRMFDSWPLALAAYNAGEGAVQRAMTGSGPGTSGSAPSQGDAALRPGLHGHDDHLEGARSGTGSRHRPTTPSRWISSSWTGPPTSGSRAGGADLCQNAARAEPGVDPMGHSPGGLPLIPSGSRPACKTDFLDELAEIPVRAGWLDHPPRPQGRNAPAIAKRSGQPAGRPGYERTRQASVPAPGELPSGSHPATRPSPTSPDRGGPPRQEASRTKTSGGQAHRQERGDPSSRSRRRPTSVSPRRPPALERAVRQTASKPGQTLKLAAPSADAIHRRASRNRRPAPRTNVPSPDPGQAVHRQAGRTRSMTSPGPTASRWRDLRRWNGLSPRPPETRPEPTHRLPPSS